MRTRSIIVIAVALVPVLTIWRPVLTRPGPAVPVAVHLESVYPKPSALVLTSTVYLPFVDRAESVPVPPPDDWLAAVNYYRALADLSPVARAAAFTPPDMFPGMSGIDPNTACWEHARYMVKTQTIQHSEDAGSPWYTPEGNTAAGASNLEVSSDIHQTDGTAVGEWLDSLTHHTLVLNPLAVYGAFGSYREDLGLYKAGFVLTTVYEDGSRYPSTVHLPVTFPRDGGYTPRLRLTADLTPYCPGYTPPTGPLIWMMFGASGITGRYIQNVDAVSFSEKDQPRPFCLLQCADTDDARLYLCSEEEVLIIPRQPLTPGAYYTDSVTVTLSRECRAEPCPPDVTETHTWSFEAVAFN
jgi:hypothetical protein